MNENMLIKVGARIQKLREAKGLTQAQLADELGVRRAVVSKWELGIQDLKTEYTVKLAEFFGVSCDELLRGVVPENSTVNYELGLSDSAIEALKERVEWYEESRFGLINKILSSGEKFDGLLASIEKYLDYYDAEKDLSGEGLGCIVENDPELYAALDKCRSVGMEIVDAYGKKMLAKSSMKDELLEIVDSIALDKSMNKTYRPIIDTEKLTDKLCESIGEQSDAFTEAQGHSDNGEH